LIGGSGWTNLYNILKAVAFVAILLIIGPLLLPVVNFVTTSLTPIGKGAGEAIGSAVSGVGKVAGKAIETVGETTLANVQDALTQNQALREQLQLTQQLAKAQGQYSQNVRAAKNAQYIQTSPGVFELLQ
jgi:cell shape-determining protein MreC